MDRKTRRTALVAMGVIVLLAVGVGFYLLGRATSTTPAAPSEPAPSTVPSVPSPSYSPTDPNGSPEPGLPQGTAVAGQGGSRRGPAGLPLGYSHDRQGAVQAATNYLIWLNSLRITDENTADALATAAAADPATRSALIDSFGLLRSGMENLTSDRPEPARGAYAIASYHSSHAVVYIWAPEVTTDASGETDDLWSIVAVPLVWSEGDWKLDHALISRTGAAAVEPSDPAGNPTAAEKHSILSRTPADPGEITDAADQSWFEYANAPH